MRVRLLHDVTEQQVRVLIACEYSARERKREQGQAQSLEELVELGRSRGYKNPIWWARKVMAARGKRD
jgi:hypothetical protein